MQLESSHHAASKLGTTTCQRLFFQQQQQQQQQPSAFNHFLSGGSYAVAGRLAGGRLEFEVTLTRDSSPASANCRSYAKLIAGSLHDDCLLLHEPVVLEHFPSPYTVKLATRSSAPPDAPALNIVASVILDQLIGLDVTKKVTVPRTAKLQQGSAIVQQPDSGQRVTEPWQQQQQQQEEGRSILATQQSKEQPQSRGDLLHQGTALPDNSMQAQPVSAAHPPQPAPTSFAYRPQGASAMPSAAGHSEQQPNDKQLGLEGLRRSVAQEHASCGGETAAAPWQDPQDLCQGGFQHEAGQQMATGHNATGRNATGRNATGSFPESTANMAAPTPASGGSTVSQPLASQHTSQVAEHSRQAGNFPTAMAGGGPQKTGRTRRKLVHTISLPHRQPSSSGPASVKLHKPGPVKSMTVTESGAMQQVQNAASVAYRVSCKVGASLGFMLLYAGHNTVDQKPFTRRQHICYQLCGSMLL